jgi:hypothetical protein
VTPDVGRPRRDARFRGPCDDEPRGPPGVLADQDDGLAAAPAARDRRDARTVHRRCPKSAVGVLSTGVADRP